MRQQKPEHYLSGFCCRIIAVASVVGRKDTNNGWLRFLPKLHTNKGEKRLSTPLLCVQHQQQMRQQKPEHYLSEFCCRIVAVAQVVGRKNTNNGWLRFLPKLYWF